MSFLIAHGSTIGIKCRVAGAPPQAPRSNGVTERSNPRAHDNQSREVNQQMKQGTMMNNIVDSFRFEELLSRHKSSGMPQEYLGGETPCERLTDNKNFDYGRLRVVSGIHCYVYD